MVEPGVPSAPSAPPAAPADATPADAAALAARVDALMPAVRADLERLVRIPSVSFAGFDRAEVARCAEECAALLRAAGAPDVRLLDAGPGAPVVHAEVPGPPGAPVVVLYAHYDVQPAGDAAAWSSPPFEPAERGGRLYGRGAADDKSGVAVHLACLRAFDGRPPVTLRVLLEGEEECGVGAFEEWPRTRPELFADAAAVVVADVGNLRTGEPTFTTGLRGTAAVTVTVRTLAGPVHSGMFGGPAPDALMALVRLLATLTDDAGDATVDGVRGFDWPGSDAPGGDLPEDGYRAEAGVLPGVPLVGSGSLASRLCSRPSVSAIGLDAPGVDGAINALVPVARAKVSLRLPPGVDAQEAVGLLGDHLRRHAPWGLSVEVSDPQTATGALVPADGPAYAAATRALAAAYGRPPLHIGSGGTIPFVANLRAALPGVEVLLFGAQDPSARIHAPDESVDLRELRDAALAQALFLAELGAAGVGA